ncbi:MAG: hypothetical protein L0Y77_04305 [Chlorobi bacterium]|nr:hypothetical protein [Chlorobiota bacterium]
MTKKQTSKILNDFKKNLGNLVPERKDQIQSLWLSLFQIYDELMYLDLTKMPKDSLSRRSKRKINLDNVLAICFSSIKLSKKKDLDNLISAFGHMDAQLFQIHLDALNARKKVTSIMNKIADMMPEDD